MTTRQEIYDRIRESSKNEVILEEMIRLGFWPRATDQPDSPAADIKREGELSRRLNELTRENRQLHNGAALKKEALQKRLKESRERRQANKERRIREREERAAAWKKRGETEILYLGSEVSNTLNHQQSDEARLAEKRLPVIHTAGDLAKAMELPLNELRFLAFDRKTSRVTHYQRFGIPKKTGGVRQISAPMPRLKRVQEWILFHILDHVGLHRAAHGFRKQRSIVTNATPHVNSDVVVNCDVENFFPTVTYPRIRGVFTNLGYSGQVATILALLCSEPDVDRVTLDGEEFFVGRTPRFLPQGAPSSPALTNIICRGMDARLQRMAVDLGFTYTRYADDITFSASGEAVRHVARVIRRIDHIVAAEGFRLHPKKTRVLRKGRRQEVTGLVVNDRLSVPRPLMRRFRSLLFQIEKDGPNDKRWGISTNVLASIEGFANFVAMVEPEKGRVLQQRVAKILNYYVRPPEPEYRKRWTGAVAGSNLPVQATGEAASVKSRTATASRRAFVSEEKPAWWKFWTWFR